MSLHKMYTAAFVFVLAVTLRGVSAAEVMLPDPPKEPASQSQSGPPTEEQRKRTLKLLREQLQQAEAAETKKGQKQQAGQQKEGQPKEGQQKEGQQKEGQEKAQQREE